MDVAEEDQEVGEASVVAADFHPEVVTAEATEADGEEDMHHIRRVTRLMARLKHA